ncbi:hypothetical protein DIZ27_19225 [Streptomyces sp. NWU339]|nr:hypothetical protein DIZ27_19225 [Streptomyces sp. NWU339]
MQQRRIRGGPGVVLLLVLAVTLAASPGAALCSPACADRITPFWAAPSDTEMLEYDSRSLGRTALGDGS